jgi:hypothetical protein
MWDSIPSELKIRFPTNLQSPSCSAVLRQIYHSACLRIFNWQNGKAHDSGIVGHKLLKPARVVPKKSSSKVFLSFPQDLDNFMPSISKLFLSFSAGFGQFYGIIIHPVWRWSRPKDIACRPQPRMVSCLSMTMSMSMTMTMMSPPLVPDISWLGPIQEYT